MDKKFVGKKSEPSREELEFIYSRLDKLSDGEILDEMQEEAFPLRSPGFIKRRRKEFAAAKAVLEPAITPLRDPLRIEHQREHLKEIASLLERWGEELGTAQNMGAYDCTYNVKREPIFPYVLEHCPSVKQKFQPLAGKRLEFEAKQGSLAKQITRESPPEANEYFSKTVACYSVDIALGHSMPYYNVSARGQQRMLEIVNMRINIAEGSPETMERCKELHKELILKYGATPETRNMASEAENLRAMQSELAEAIEHSRLRQGWIHNKCDYCPSKGVK